MPKDWNMLRWIFRRAMEPRRLAYVLFAGAVLFDLGSYLDDKKKPFVVFFSLILLILLWVMSYRPSGKWYDWRDAYSKEEWKYIKEVLMLERDALVHPKKPPSLCSVWFKDDGLSLLILFLSILVAVLVFACRCFNDTCRCFNDKGIIEWLLSWVPTIDVSNSGAHYVALVAALIAATATVITVFLTVRQNTRSTNREAWNNSVRKLMACLIAGVPRNCAELADSRKKYQLQYFKLALHLNPSEKAHRGLLYAVAVMYGAEKDWLARDCPCRDARDCPCRELASFNRPERCLERRVQGITRLSNVVFKTEWEQVKRLT